MPETGDASTGIEASQSPVRRLMLNARKQLVKLAARQAIPAMYTDCETTAVGGLVSYSTSLPDACRQAAGCVSRSRDGRARPAPRGTRRSGPARRHPLRIGRGTDRVVCAKESSGPFIFLGPSCNVNLLSSRNCASMVALAQDRLEQLPAVWSWGGCGGARNASNGANTGGQDLLLSSLRGTLFGDRYADSQEQH